MKVIFFSLLTINILALNSLHSMNSEWQSYFIKEELMNEVNKSIEDKNQDLINDLLYKAIRNNNLQAIKLLVSKDNIEYATFIEGTPLYFAITQIIKLFYNNSDILEYLLTYNPNVNYALHGVPILHTLSSSVQPCNSKEQKIRIKIIKLLLNHNLDINIINNYGNIPLYTAARSKNLEIAQFLIDLGASLNYQYLETKDTLLHLLLKHNNYEAVKLLIYNGADITIKNDNDKSFIDYANKANAKDQTQLAQILSDYETCQLNTLTYLSDDLKINKDLAKIIISYAFQQS